MTEEQRAVAKKIKEPLLIAIAYQETRLLKKTKVSSKGAIGTFQQIPKYADNPKEFIKKHKNLEYAKRQCASSLLKWLEVSKGDKKKALAGYAAGYNFKAGMPYANNVIKLEKEFRLMKQKGEL